MKARALPARFYDLSKGSPYGKVVKEAVTGTGSPQDDQKIVKLIKKTAE